MWSVRNKCVLSLQHGGLYWLSNILWYVCMGVVGKDGLQAFFVRVFKEIFLGFLFGDPLEGLDFAQSGWYSSCHLLSIPTNILGQMSVSEPWCDVFLQPITSFPANYCAQMCIYYP